MFYQGSGNPLGALYAMRECIGAGKCGSTQHCGLRQRCCREELQRESNQSQQALARKNPQAPHS